MAGYRVLTFFDFRENTCQCLAEMKRKRDTWKFIFIFFQVVKAASPALLRVIAMGAFLIYCTVSGQQSFVCTWTLLEPPLSYNFITDDCYVPATVAVHLRRQDLASRNRVFSYLWCSDVENLEVGGRVDWISHWETRTENLAFDYPSATLAVRATWAERK